MARIKQWKEHQGIVLDSIKGFDVIECEGCGFKHIIPIPTFEELAYVYTEEYYSTEKPLYLERHKEDLDWWSSVYRERYNKFEQHLEIERRRILDVGSGPGYFLLHGKNRGWQTLGIEPSAQAAEHSRGLGLTIVEDFLTEQTARKLELFDVVHMSEVLEHIPDPKGMLKTVASLLQSGGLVCVVVPNDYNPFQKALRDALHFKPWWAAPPHHINYFNFTSLHRLLESVGFEVIHQEATFPIDIFLLMGDNYVGNDALGRVCHQKRKNFELNLAKAGQTELLHSIYEMISTLNLGREALILGKFNPQCT